MKKLKKHFISAIDQHLRQFDQTHPKSASQQAEIAKYQRIYAQRDQTTSPQDPQGHIWD